MSTNTMAPALTDTAVEHVIALMRTTRRPHARAVVAVVLATVKAPGKTLLPRWAR